MVESNDVTVDLDKQRRIQNRRIEIDKKKTILLGNLEKDRKHKRKIAIACFVVWATIITLFPLLFVFGASAQKFIFFYVTLITYGLMGAGVAKVIGVKTRAIEEALQDIEFEEELLRYETPPDESRAEELLRINQYQLRRYYDLNLSQNFWVFAVGILCILLGVIVVGVTILLIHRSPQAPWQEKTVLGLVGAVGSLMANYVGAIYLKMHSAISGSLTTFHATLVSTHKLFLANLLVSRIADEKKRETALANLSLAVADYKPTTGTFRIGNQELMSKRSAKTGK
jgi:hypothetical protein